VGVSRRQAIAAMAGASTVAAVGVATRAWIGHRPLSLPAQVQQAVTRLTPPRSAVRVELDVSQPLRWISPLIYGVSVAGAEDLAAAGASLNRWGGNPNTRYNWVLGNVWNTARDWQFNNYGWTDGQPPETQASSAADDFVKHNRATGVESLITVPAIGWVARDGLVDSRSSGVPAHGAPPNGQQADAIEGYNPTDNRNRTSVRSMPRKGAPFVDQPDPGGTTVYQDEWVAHLVRRFGTADRRGVRYYAIDNEPDLWSETHTDISPVEQGYQSMVDTFLEYAGAVKDVDPSARVAGPALSGWTPLLYSPLDRGTDNFRTHRERRDHGDTPFLPWWLERVREQDDVNGRRTLDVLDVHWYPQGDGVYTGATDADTNALRLRSTRSLWDPSYTDESWIRDTVQLIPRLRAWIDEAYPETGIGIGEWNWGADSTINGALAIADVLGIYGREGVEYATYWTAPKANTPGAAAFRLYTNYDGHGQQFGDLALGARVDAGPDDATVYASQDSASRDVIVLAINKRDNPLQASFRVNGANVTTGRCYSLAPDAPSAIVDNGVMSIDGTPVTLPAASVTLLRIPTSSDG
jgi:hypothetical protein